MARPAQPRPICSQVHLEPGPADLEQRNAPQRSRVRNCLLKPLGVGPQFTHRKHRPHPEAAAAMAAAVGSRSPSPVLLFGVLLVTAHAAGRRKRPGRGEAREDCPVLERSVSYFGCCRLSRQPVGFWGRKHHAHMPGSGPAWRKSKKGPRAGLRRTVSGSNGTRSESAWNSPHSAGVVSLRPESNTPGEQVPWGSIHVAAAVAAVHRPDRGRFTVSAGGP